MRQLPQDMYEADLERRLRNEYDAQYDQLESRIQILETPTFESTSYQSPPNYLENSHPEWSTLAYGTAGTSPGTVSDANRNCYNWEYGTAATTDLSTNFSALLASGHTGFAGLNVDAPIWDRENGTFRLGGDTTLYDIACPLPTDFVFPGQRFYVYFEASVAASDTDIGDNQQFYCGFWDDTAKQEKWIEGSAFTPTISVYGASGSRTLEYKILAKTDEGTEMLSTAVSTTSAPATLTPENHIRLSFSGAPGFIEYAIYRNDGGVYRLVHTIRNSIDLQYYDMQENAGALVSGYPSVSTSTPKAYSVTTLFDPGDVGTFTPHTMTIQVPTTYNRSNTGNGQQWFRFGLTELVGASGSRREVVIRRISVSEGYGSWTRSPRDMQAASSPSTSTASGPTTGTTTTNPPPGGGRPVCVTLDTLIDTPNGRVPIKNILPKDKVSYGMDVSVKAVKTGIVQEVIQIRTDAGHVLRCTPSHRLIRSRSDVNGTSVRLLKVGDKILARDFTEVTIISKIRVVGECEVKSLTLPSPHLFVTNGLLSHNSKQEIPV